MVTGFGGWLEDFGAVYRILGWFIGFWGGLWGLEGLVMGFGGICFFWGVLGFLGRGLGF